jgi:hypothetical protein
MREQQLTRNRIFVGYVNERKDKFIKHITSIVTPSASRDMLLFVKMKIRRCRKENLSTLSGYYSNTKGIIDNINHFF